MSVLSVLGKVAEKVSDRLLPDKAESRRQQSELNQAEIGGAPQSRLRLWRSFLGWVLAVVLTFEVVGRPVLQTYFPGVKLPPSVLEQVQALLLGMLGLGF